jgi:hypothetical protein
LTPLIVNVTPAAFDPAHGCGVAIGPFVHWSMFADAPVGAADVGIGA